MRDEVAAVVITRDLEWNVERALDAVFAGVPEIRQVVLSDSASTDGTVDIALKYPRPVRVCRLSGQQRLTAAAGRYVGQMNCDSEFVLFLDGDCELIPSFYENAVRVLQANPDIGVVGGIVINLPKDPTTSECEVPILASSEFDDVFHAGGACALYRRSALEQADSFSPRVYSDEEPALAVRLRHAGYRVVRMRSSSVYHYTDPVDDVSTLFKRRGRNLWVGHGQNMREFAGTAMLAEYMRERGHGIAPAVLLLAVLVCVVIASVTGQWVWIAALLATLLALFVGLAVAKRSASKAAFTFVKRFLILEGTIRGILDSPSNPNADPVDYEVLR